VYCWPSNSVKFIEWQDKLILRATPIEISVILYMYADEISTAGHERVQEFLLAIIYEVTNDLCRVPNVPHHPLDVNFQSVFNVGKPIQL
jgi:hypothetical protein